MPRPIEALVHTAALAPTWRAPAPRRPTPGCGRWSRPTPTATASNAPSPACTAPTALRCSTWPRLQRCARWAGAARCCCWKAASSRATWKLCSRLNLWHVVHCDEQIDWLSRHKTQQPQRVFLKMNSGMNRLGFVPAAFRAAWARLNALPQVDEISLMTHFSDADGERGVAHQVAAFDAATRDLPGERSPVQQRRRAAPRPGQRLGARRHPVLRQRARLPGPRHRATGACSRR